MISRALFENSSYCACVTRAGLSVQRKRKNMTGVILKPSHSQYAEYLAAFESEPDADVLNQLCRSLLSE